VDRRFVFDSVAKRHFLKWMRKLETFCGVQIVTYCLMSNHCHLLIRALGKATAPKLTAERLRKLLPEIYSKDNLLSAEQELDRAVEGGEEALAALLARYEARRHSMPIFMKELKQRFCRKLRGIDAGEMRCLRDLQAEGGGEVSSQFSSQENHTTRQKTTGILVAKTSSS